MSLGSSRRRIVDSATAAEIPKLLVWDDWLEEALERLAWRVEQAAHDDPPDGYALALRCLAFLAQHAGDSDSDTHARALTAGGAAARQLGRAGEAGQLYERALPLARKPRTRARLWLSIASLALFEDRFEAAFSAVDRATRAGSGIPEIEVLATNLRGATHLTLGLANKDQSALAAAAGCFAEAIDTAPDGSVQQVSALLNLASALEARSSKSQLHRFKPILERLRMLARKSRAKGIKKVAAYADWIEGRLALRLGSTREGIRRLRKAGQAFARAGCHADAIRVATDMVERGTEHGAEAEAYAAGSEIAVLIPRDSPQRPAIEAFEAFEALEDTRAWAGGVRKRIAAG